MHALVTGGGGFLGRYIVEQLVTRGDRVRSFGRGAYPELEELGVEVVRGDIAEPASVARACQRIDCVFHVAAIAGIGIKWRPFERINLRGSEHVLAACRKHGVRRLIYTSSPSVVFAGQDQCGVDEQTPCDFPWMVANRAHYSRSKALAERAVLAANDAGLQTCALRPHLIWGPRDNHLIPRLIDRACSGRLRQVGDGTNLVDTTYVENAAAAHVQAAEVLAARPEIVGGKTYFLSQGKPVNCWQWINGVLAIAEAPAITKSISFTTARRMGRACEAAYRLLNLKSEPPMTRFLAGQLAKSHWFNIDAARRELGYDPIISAEEGLKRMAAWLEASPAGRGNRPNRACG
jgi:nucleoside-diphosphate-sugar epimerase